VDVRPHGLLLSSNSVGAEFPFFADPERAVQRDLDIQEYTGVKC